MKRLLKPVTIALIGVTLGLNLGINAGAKYAPIKPTYFSNIWKTAQAVLDARWKSAKSKPYAKIAQEVEQIDKAQQTLNVFKGVFDAALLTFVEQLKEVFASEVSNPETTEHLNTLIELTLQGGVTPEGAQLLSYARNPPAILAPGTAALVRQETNALASEAGISLFESAKNFTGSIWGKIGLPSSVKELLSKITSNDKTTIAKFAGVILATAILGGIGTCWLRGKAEGQEKTRWQRFKERLFGPQGSL